MLFLLNNKSFNKGLTGPQKKPQEIQRYAETCIFL